MLGVVGRSGSGKSTLTRLLQGINRDYSGFLRIDGRNRKLSCSTTPRLLRRWRRLMARRSARRIGFREGSQNRRHRSALHRRLPFAVVRLVKVIAAGAASATKRRPIRRLEIPDRSASLRWALSRQIGLGGFRRRIRLGAAVIREQKQWSSSLPLYASGQYRIYSDNAAIRPSIGNSATIVIQCKSC